MDIENIRKSIKLLNLFKITGFPSYGNCIYIYDTLNLQAMSPILRSYGG